MSVAFVKNAWAEIEMSNGFSSIWHNHSTRSQGLIFIQALTAMSQMANFLKDYLQIRLFSKGVLKHLFA